MKPEKPKSPRQELEASLTALLLGELPAEKAAALRELVAKDAELLRLYERLEQTIGLVKETAVPAEETTQSAPLKLSTKRREQLFAHFKTIAPKEFAKPRDRTIQVRELAIAAGIVAFIGVAAWFTFNLTQQSFSSTSRMSQVHVLASRPAATEMVANDMTKAGPRSTVGSITEQTTARLAAETALEMAQNNTATLASGSGGSSKGIGNPWQTIFDKNPGQRQDLVTFAPSAGKPITDQIVLPTATDYAVSTTPRGLYDDQVNAFNLGDPQWVGIAERGDHSPPAHRSTNQFVSRFASIVVQTNQLDVGGMANLAYKPRVPVLVTNASSTHTSGFAYYLDINGNGRFDTNGAQVPAASAAAPEVASETRGAGESEIYRRRYGGVAWTDNAHAKQGGVGLADGSVEQLGRSKLQEALRNSSENKPAEKVPVIDPATGLPVAGAYASGAIDPATGLPIPAEVAESMQVPAMGNARAWTGAAGTDEFFTTLDLSKGTASQTGSKGGTRGGGGAGGGGRVTVSGQVPARALREPASVPAQTPVASSPSTPVDGEKLAELAQKGKDTSGSNVYLGMELAKADVKFQTWGLEAGGFPSGAKKEEESLKQLGEVRDGVTIAGRATTPEKRGFAPMGPLGTPSPSTKLVDDANGATRPDMTKSFEPITEKPPVLADLPVVGKDGEARPGALKGEKLVTRQAMVDVEKDWLNPPPSRELLPAQNPAVDWNFGTGTPNRAWFGGAGVTNMATAPGQTQSPSNVYSLEIVGYVNGTTSATTNSPLFAGAPISKPFADRLQQAGTSTASYDRYTFNRNLEQLGAEPDKETKLALNYSNVTDVPATQQGASKVDPLNVVGYYDTSKLAESNRSAVSRQLSQSGVKELADQEPKVRQAEADVERLRQEYKIADAMAAADAPTMLMSAESLRKLEGMRIELESQVMQQQTQLDALKKMPREKLVVSLPTAAPDMALNSLLEQKNLAEQSLIIKQRELGESNPEVANLRGQVSDLNGKIDRQTDGILSGLDGRVTAVKEQLSKLRNEVEKAKTNDIASAKQTQPYWEAKRKLDDLEQFSKVLQMKIASENIEASLPKTTMVEIMDDAVPTEAKKTDVWDRIRGKGKYESQARIKVDRDQSDISFSTNPKNGTAYDPYFIQNEFETIKSDKVLGNVVASLNLQREWANGGQTLSTNQAIALLKQKLDLRPERNTSFVDIAVKSDKPQEAAELANAIARAYQAHRLEIRRELSLGGIHGLEERWKEQEAKIQVAQKQVDKLRDEGIINQTTAAASQPTTNPQVDVAPPKPAVPLPVPQPEVQTRENAFSTFSLNVSDVAFKLAAASLEKGQMPEPGSIRSEEFINAFDYRDPEAPAGVPVAFAWERARYPYAQNRDLLRFSIKTAAQGRQTGRPLNIVLLLDNSGSMERADRVAIIREALKVLASQLQPQDKLSVITFARTAQLRVDGVAGNQAAQVAEDIGGLTPEGGTNIEEAMNLAYQTALRHYLANGINRVVLLTDGAANLGNVEPESLKQKVEANRKQGVALDCFGIGWEGFNDDLLETLSRNGDGRYGFINSPEEAATEFAGQLAGALNVAASDVKVQVEFNPARVTAYRQIGYAKHQLTKEQFRDNTVDAAEIAAQEAGNALYVVEVNPSGHGPLGTVRVRFKVPGTSDYREHEWTVPFNGNAVALEQASPAMRLAASASAFSEWLASSPYATEVTPDTLLSYLGGVPEVYGADARPKKLEWMIRQAKSLSGK